MLGFSENYLLVNFYLQEEYTALVRGQDLGLCVYEKVEKQSFKLFVSTIAWRILI